MDSEEPAVKQGPLRPARRANAEGQGEYGTGRGGQRPVRSAKASAGSENSFDRSPLHPRAKGAAGRGSNTNIGSSYPAFELGKKANSTVSHGTPGIARQRPTTANRGDESPDIGATVPKFGDWDENDPQKTPDFTQAFERVRDERNNNGTGTPKHHDAYGTRTKQTDRQPKVSECHRNHARRHILCLQFDLEYKKLLIYESKMSLSDFSNAEMLLFSLLVKNEKIVTDIVYSCSFLVLELDRAMLEKKM